MSIVIDCEHPKTTLSQLFINGLDELETMMDAFKTDLSSNTWDQEKFNHYAYAFGLQSHINFRFFLYHRSRSFFGHHPFIENGLLPASQGWEIFHCALKQKLLEKKRIDIFEFIEKFNSIDSIPDQNAQFKQNNGSDGPCGWLSQRQAELAIGYKYSEYLNALIKSLDINSKNLLLNFIEKESRECIVKYTISSEYFDLSSLLFKAFEICVIGIEPWIEQNKYYAHNANGTPISKNNIEDVIFIPT